jgi:hypothetical protein
MTTLTPTTPENRARIDAFFTATQDLILGLADRWQDEAQYEDIEDYAAVVKKSLPKGFSFVAMTKRPFGFKFRVGTDAVYAITASSSTYKWSRVS